MAPFRSRPLSDRARIFKDTLALLAVGPKTADGLLRSALVAILIAGMAPCATGAQPLQTHLPHAINESAGIGHPGSAIVGKVPGENQPGPAVAVGVPTAYGAEFGDLFAGAAYQRFLAPNIPERNDAATYLGVGVGNARKAVGAEITYARYDMVGGFFGDGSLSVKIHRHLFGGLSVAVGMEDLFRYGDWVSRSAYVVASQTVQIDREVLTEATGTVGVGDGRFNTMENLSQGKNEASLFGGLSVQFMSRVNVVGTWYGQDLNLGLSVVAPGPVPITLTPVWVSVLNRHVDGDRFALSMGTSLRFP